MASIEETVEAHYAVAGLGPTILDALRRTGKDPATLTPADLAAVDEFHVRGRRATQELAEWVGVETRSRVLDVGCGIGGSARYLAQQFGCRVTGLDLTRDFCEVATMLSGLTGLGDRAEFQQGSALDMPFDDESFDIVWTEHAQMNIEDKAAFYSEIARVLQPGGRLAFHDIFQGPGGESHFPVPWAREAHSSFLAPPGEVQGILDSLGLQTRRWEDSTQRSLDWFLEIIAAASPRGASPLGLHLLLGADSTAKLENQVRNLKEGRIVLVQAVLEKVTQGAGT
jgi:SAM-dependent methyltransferase